MDFKCQNGDEEWVFDQVSEAGREQTHCHTYQRLNRFHDYKMVTGIKSKKNSSSETLCLEMQRYQMLGHTLEKKGLGVN